MNLEKKTLEIIGLNYFKTDLILWCKSETISNVSTFVCLEKYMHKYAVVRITLRLGAHFITAYTFLF